MSNGIWFKIKGIHKLLSMRDLRKIPNISDRCIRVIDTKSQRNYLTNYATILKKFR